jgi:hypothetical protein
MNGRFQMQGGKNWFLPKEINANRFFWDSHWLEIWSNHFYPSMGPNGGSVTMDSGLSLAGNLVKPLLSLYGTEWRERGYGLRRKTGFITKADNTTDRDWR